MVYVIGLNTNGWFPQLAITGVGESVVTQVVSIRGHISCITQNISYNVAKIV